MSEEAKAYYLNGQVPRHGAQSAWLDEHLAEHPHDQEWVARYKKLLHDQVGLHQRESGRPEALCRSVKEAAACFMTGSCPRRSSVALTPLPTSSLTAKPQISLMINFDSLFQLVFRNTFFLVGKKKKKKKIPTFHHGCKQARAVPRHLTGMGTADPHLSQGLASSPLTWSFTAFIFLGPPARDSPSFRTHSPRSPPHGHV